MPSRNRIPETSDVDCTHEEDEQRFLRTLESPKLEMGSMHPAKPHGRKSATQKTLVGRESDIPSIGDEAPPSRLVGWLRSRHTHPVW